MKPNDTQKQLVLNGNLRNVMWRLSIPAILAMVLYGLNAFMDTVYIGQLLNATALSGVALAYPLTSIMLGVGSWVGTGAGNYLSILLGKEDVEGQRKIIPNATLFTVLSTLVLAVPVYLFAEPLIRLMGGKGEILAYGVEYFKITLLAFPFWVYSLQLNFIVRAEGKMMTAAVIMACGLVVNLILTPVSIIYFGMGVDGAAWATNIGMLIYCVVGHLYFVRGGASFPPNVNSIAYDKEIFANILKLGFPGFILSMMGLVQAIFVFNAVVKYGTDADLAFFAAANRIVLFLLTPLFGLMRALQPIEGVNFGAGQYERVKASFWLFCRTGFLLVMPFWLFLMAFPELSVQLVLPGKVLTAEELLNFRVYMAVIPFLPFVFMSLTHLPAIEQPKFASIIGMARQVVFYIPVMIFLPRWMGVSGVYYGATIIDITITAWLLIVVINSFKKLDSKAAEVVV